MALGDQALRMGDHVFDHQGDQPAHQFVDPPHRFDPGMAGVDTGQYIADERNRSKVIDREDLRPQSVVDVMGVIGNVVCDGAGLGFGARVMGEFEVMAGAVIRNLLR
jgi:hypothetical protein